MKTTHRNTIALLVLLAASALSISSTSQANILTDVATSKFVGTYFGVTQNTMATFNADKSVVIVNSDMFNLQGYNIRSTPALGTWRRVGRDSIRITYVLFSAEPHGLDYIPGGAMYKVSLLATFEPPVRGKSPAYKATEIEIAVYSAGQDPTKDDPLTVLYLPDGRGHRLQPE